MSRLGLLPTHIEVTLLNLEVKSRLVVADKLETRLAECRREEQLKKQRQPSPNVIHIKDNLHRPSV
jgi:hypothetical protein